MRFQFEATGKWIRRNPSYVGLIAIEAILVFSVCIPYLIRNNLLEHDSVGHWAAAAFTDRYLFPAVSGYNPYYYCGAPQNLLYPPLLSYLSAALGRLVGVAAGLKLLVAGAAMATPLAAYWCARAHSLRRNPSLVAAVAVFGELALDTRELGGNFASTFVTGNAANALGLPLFLAYAASLARPKSKLSAWVLPTILLAANLTTHLVGGLIAVALLAVHGALAARTQRAFLLLLHGLWAFALSCFFIVPLLAFQNFGSLDNRSYNQYPDSILLVVSSMFVLACYYVSRRKSRHALAPLALLCGALLLFHGFIFNDYFPRGSGLHVHRFKLYDEIGLTILAVWLANGWLIQLPKLKRFSVGSAVCAMALLLSVIGLQSIESRGVPAQPVPNLERLSSRVLVMSSPGRQVSDHALQHLVAMKTGNAVGKGLFIEAAANARVLVDLELLLARDPMQVRTWGIELDAPEKLELLRPKLLKMLERMGFGYVLANEPLREDAGLLRLRDLDHGFTLYRASYAELAEVWTRPILVLDSSKFTSQREVWPFDDIDALSVERAAKVSMLPAIEQGALEKARVASVRFDSQRQRIELNVESKDAVPVLLKFTYMPQFEARDSEGRLLPLLRAAPNLMLVIGRGQIVVNYERTALERTSTTISWAAAVALLGVVAAGAIGRLKRARAPVFHG